MEATVSRKAIEFARLTETSSDTDMGRLLRLFWHPVALSDDLEPGMARPLRVLSEDLTLYRGRSGNYHLVGGHCAHRCTVLHTGWVEGERIRCMYHGWLYDETGACIEIPAEEKARSKLITIPSYPVHEYCGLVFAYFGSGKPPQFSLPRKSVLEGENRTAFAKREIWDCSWFQQIENSMDAVHLNFAHQWGTKGQFGSRIAAGGVIPRLEYEETSSGIRQIATRSKDNVRISDWTFPNNNHVVAPTPNRDDPWIHISAWQTPVDDKRTLRFTIYSTEESDLDKLNQLRIGFDLKFDPSNISSELFQGKVMELSEPALISVQDYVAVRGQGEIVNRNAENLSTSDAGVLFLRKVFYRELDLIENGMPTKNWHKLEKEPTMKAPPPVKAAE